MRLNPGNGRALACHDLQIREDGGDLALQNLVGDDAERNARA